MLKFTNDQKVVNLSSISDKKLCILNVHNERSDNEIRMRLEKKDLLYID